LFILFILNFCVLFNDDRNGNDYVISMLDELVLRVEDKRNDIKISICLQTTSW